jgi:hypothetical protein
LKLTFSTRVQALLVPLQVKRTGSALNTAALACTLVRRLSKLTSFLRPGQLLSRVRRQDRAGSPRDQAVIGGKLATCGLGSLSLHDATHAITRS